MTTAVPYHDHNALSRKSKKETMELSIGNHSSSQVDVVDIAAEVTG